jgi:hypothetical protein
MVQRPIIKEAQAKMELNEHIQTSRVKRNQTTTNQYGFENNKSQSEQKLCDEQKENI